MDFQVRKEVLFEGLWSADLQDRLAEVIVFSNKTQRHVKTPIH